MSASAISTWRTLFRIGSISFLISAVLTLAFFILLISLNPPSDTAGLLNFVLTKRQTFILVQTFLVIEGLFILPVILVLYPALKDINPSIALLAVSLGALGLIFHFASVASSLSLVGLSDGYSAASGTPTQAAYLASAVAVRGVDGSTTALNNLFFSLFGILASWPMVKSPTFGKLAGYVGILWGLVGTAITGLPILDVQGLVGLIVGIIQVIWLVVVGLRLWKLS
jgi:Domain of unknown function (DUF4386)